MKSILYVIKENGIIIFSISVTFITILLLPLHFEKFYNNEKENVRVAENVRIRRGKTLFLPLNDSFKKSYSSKNNGIKIVSFIDGNCGVCIEELYKWKQIINKYEVIDKAELIFFVNSMDFKSLISFIEVKEPFPKPLINDQENLFFNQNKLSRNKMFQTFLLDKNNKVILVGNPIFGDKVLSLYIRTIQELNED